MRISEKMVYDSLRNSVMDNQNRLFTIQSQIAANTKLVKLSDDPRSSEKASQLDTNKSEMEQFKRNILFGQGSLDISTNALQGVNDLLVRAKELAIQMANGDMNASDRKVAAVEASEIFKQIVGYANTRNGGEYVFSGYESSRAAYDTDGNWQGDDGLKLLRIGQVERIQINETGSSIFGSRVTAGSTPPAPPAGYTAGDSIMEDLAQFKAALENNDTTGVQNAIDALDRGQQKVLQYEAAMGTRSKQMGATSSALDNLVNSVDTQLSTMRDVDVASMAIELNKQQAVYQASLAVAGKISGMSLLDYLK